MQKTAKIYRLLNCADTTVNNFPFPPGTVTNLHNRQIKLSIDKMKLKPKQLSFIPFSVSLKKKTTTTKQQKYFFVGLLLYILLTEKPYIETITKLVDPTVKL